MPNRLPGAHLGMGNKQSLTMPHLLLGSDAAGWDGVAARVYHEPRRMDLWRPPAAPILTLGLVTHGAMHLEHRPVQGSWHGEVVHQDGLFLRPDYHERYDLRWHAHSAHPIQTLVIQLHQDVVFRVINEVAERDPAHVTFIERVGFHDPLVLQLGLALHQELAQPTPMGALYAHTVAQMLTVHLLRRYTSGGAKIWEPPRGLTQAQVQRVTDVVHANIAHALTLPVLAQHVDLSAYHFARMFRQATGESPHQFVLRQRIERAQQLLKDTNMSLAHVAEATGFATQSHFTHVFKRHLGCTPRTYRQRVR